MWIVMTSTAKMPTSVRSPYRNVAIVQLTQDYTSHNLMPKMISTRARGVVSVRHYGHHFVGKTEKCAYRVALAEAKAEALARNNLLEVTPDMLVSWGGSA